jgi:hypothetical protein
MRLLPLFWLYSSACVAVSAPLGALALEIHDRLRFSPLAVGCLIGLQSLATLLTRH